MKVNWRIPSTATFASWLAADALRSLDVRAAVEAQSSTEFTRDLAARLLASRFEPRLFESCVERLWLFPERLDLNEIQNSLATSPWPEIWALMMAFVLRLQLPGERHSLRAIHDFCLARAKSRLALKACETFYVGLHRPGSARTERMISECPRLWLRYGFLALDAPYSKELLALVPRARAVLPPVRTSVDERLRALWAKEPRRWLSLSEIERELGCGLSLRQIQRFLARANWLRRSGRLKGTRYRLGRSLSVGA